MNLFFSVVALELFLGGGGRLVEIGPVTLRMILFAVCLCASAYLAVARFRKDDAMPVALLFVGAYLLVHLPALIVGALRGAPVGDAMTEAQQSLYWLAAPFFAVALHKPEMALRAATLVKTAGVILSVVYLGTLALLATGVLDFAETYVALNATGEFFFRGESFFFYKGFLYLGIATLFFVADRDGRSTVLMLVVVVALIMTLTRGFVLSTSIAAILMLVAQRRWKAVGISALIVALAAFMVWVYLPSTDEAFLGQRDASNSQRSEDIDYMLDHFQLWIAAVGSGLGTTINERVNIENTFLWAAWKLGVVGLLFWLMPLLVSLRYYLNVPKAGRYRKVATAYFFGTVLVYLQTATNPYLNNPIGLSFVLISLFSLRTLSLAERRRPHSSSRPAPATPSEVTA